MNLQELDSAIRRVPDFPKPGITFYDITSVLAKPKVFQGCVDMLAAALEPLSLDGLFAVEARGFVFASAVAAKTGIPLFLARKPGKLPNTVVKQAFDLEYGSDVICVQELDRVSGRRVAIVDDLIATGGTVRALCALLVAGGMRVEMVACVIGLPFLGYEARVAPHPVRTLIDFHAE